jgi:hypothetical protein
MDLIWGMRQEIFRKIRNTKIEPDWIHPGEAVTSRA